MIELTMNLGSALWRANGGDLRSELLLPIIVSRNECRNCLLQYVIIRRELPLRNVDCQLIAWFS